MSRSSSRHGFTLVELLIVITVMSILSALLLPAINSSRERGRQSVCGARVQQIGIALTKASANKKGRTRTVDDQQVNLLDPRYLQPDATATEDWRKKGVLAAELQDEAEIWRCPSDPNADTPSFGFNARISGLGSRDGSRLVVLEYNQRVARVAKSGSTFDTSWQEDVWENGDNTWTEDDSFAPRHFETANAYTHGKSVASYRTDDIDPSDCFNQKRYWLPYRDRMQLIAWGTTAADESTYNDENALGSQEKDDPYYGSCDLK
ncbi:MAG: type II secretion system protein [Pirellulales bacterium]|nr:type II secretion system protein [Pirellulales bacterium]